MAEIIVAIAAKVAGYLVAPIRRQLGYVFNYHGNVEDLKSQLEKMGHAKVRVERSVDLATRSGDEIESAVDNWLKSVDGITEEAGKFLDDEDEAKRWCFNGSCPNLKSRYQRSKKAKNTVTTVVRIQDGGNFDRVSYRAHPQGIGSASIKGYEVFESRMSILEEILGALTNPNINMIGVYGMGGVGKTMLVKEVARKAIEGKLFDVVVIAVVSQISNIREIQGEIADKLGLRFDQESESGRADRLAARLKKEKSILLILDDIWAKLDLEKVGICFKDDYKECKILLTSRNRDVLSNEMGTQKDFGIEVLLEEEAWNLFKKMVGDSVEALDLKPTAIEVAKKGAGLPIAIAAVASALKNKSLPVWKDALQQLRSSAPANINGMHAKVYSTLELSYKSLESEEAKSLFLLCVLLPEDCHISIQDFLKYGKGLGLFQGINTLERARNRLHTLVHTLKASCLLLDINTTGLVGMHDVVRDVGISIASKDKNMLIVRNGVELDEWMTEEKVRICRAISLPSSNIHEIPTGLECPELKFLLLVSKDPSLKIPNTFFEGMKQLKVLNLTNMCFSSLPSSLHFLTSLQTLCLDYCMLQDLSIIGELKKLEILSFIGSDIEELPIEIGQLIHLKLLDLRNCSKLKVIPSNVIARLSQLEDLYMENSFVQWEVDGNASLAELKHLSRLVTLDIHIPDAKILPKDLLFEKLLRYRIFIGDVWDWSGDYETSRTLKLKLNTRILLEFGLNMLLKRTEDLYLDELNGIRSILYDLDGQGFPHLKHLHVQNSSEIEYIINTMRWVPHSEFPNLESFFLHNLINLKKICHGPLPAESFCNLRTVKVEYCDRLKNIFSLSVARRLSQLQEINIRKCKILYEIVAEGEGAEGNNEAMDKIMFPQLCSLTLGDLPGLMSFCSKLKTDPSLNYSPATDARSGEIISEGEHGIPMPLFDEKVAFPSLEKLVIESISLKEIWPSQLPIGSFCKLKNLQVKNCRHLLNIVPSDMLMRLQNIESLTVHNYGGLLEYIFDLEGLNDIEKHVVRATQLRYLDLYSLPSLMAIWKNNCQGIFPFQNLNSLKVNWCKRLRNIFTTSIAKSLVQLQELSITWCPLVEEIVEKGVEGNEETTNKIVFSKVTSLTFYYLAQLKSFCQGIHISDWPSLKNLEVSDCENIEMLASELSSFEEMRRKGHLDTPTGQPLFLVGKVAFPNLETLYLSNLPSLMVVWKKDSQGIFHFQNLSSIYIGHCESLINIFTTSVAKSLAQLQGMVGEIVEKEGVEDETAIDKIVFSQVTSLTFYYLVQLKSFCQGIHLSEWPSLKILKVSSCFNVEIFASELSSFEEMRGKGHPGSPTKQPLFLVNKVAFHNMEEMELKYMSNMREIWHGHFHVGSFCKLRVLKVMECNELFNVFPISLLHNLQNLEELSVESCSSMKEVFELEGLVGEVEHASTLPRLRELRLAKLPKLMHIWKEDSQLSSVFEDLSTLEVRSCGSLTHLLPSTIAKSLVRINDITVDDCEMMKEIIGGEKGEAADETTFNQLNSLQLKDLPKLTSFCSSSNTFSFPSLEKVLVEECPKLKTFSNNILSTPKLKKVHVKEDKWLWDSDLNSTIQNLFIKKNTEISEED